MKTTEIDIIEKNIDFEFTLEVDKAYFKHWKPKTFLDYSYSLSMIETTQEQYTLLIKHLKSENASGIHPKFKLNWSIPEEIDIDWWNPTQETIENTFYIPIDKGSIQTKYEDGKIFILKTKN